MSIWPILIIGMLIALKGSGAAVAIKIALLTELGRQGAG